jgi:hypothetical protein
VSTILQQMVERELARRTKPPMIIRHITVEPVYMSGTRIGSRVFDENQVELEESDQRFRSSVWSTRTNGPLPDDDEQNAIVGGSAIFRRAAARSKPVTIAEDVRDAEDALAVAAEKIAKLKGRRQ